jgi:hypothetical protein
MRDELMHPSWVKTPFLRGAPCSDVSYSMLNRDGTCVMSAFGAPKRSKCQNDGTLKGETHKAWTCPLLSKESGIVNRDEQRLTL